MTNFQIPKTIHFCWFGASPYPAVVKRCISSWKTHCPDYEIKIWNEENYDISKHRFMLEAYEQGKWAFVSDIARLDIIYNHGGVYLDTDVELIQNLDAAIQNASAFFASDGSGVNTGLGFGAVRYSEVVLNLFREYDGKRFKNGNELDLTPCTVHNTNALEKIGFKNDDTNQKIGNVYLFDRSYFSPVYGSNQKLIISNQTIGIHHSARTWHTGKDKIKSTLRLFLGQKCTSLIKKLISR